MLGTRNTVKVQFDQLEMRLANYVRHTCLGSFKATHKGDNLYRLIDLAQSVQAQQGTNQIAAEKAACTGYQDRVDRRVCAMADRAQPCLKVLSQNVLHTRTMHSQKLTPRNASILETTYCSISSVSAGCTPIQKVLFITMSVLVRSPLMRKLRPLM